MPSLWNVEEQTVKTLPDNIIKIKFTELGLKNKPDIGTKKNDPSKHKLTSYARCNTSLEEFVQSRNKIMSMYNSHEEFTKAAGVYILKVNDNKYQIIRRTISEKIIPGWIYNNTEQVTENKVLVTYKKLFVE